MNPAACSWPAPRSTTQGAWPASRSTGTTQPRGLQQQTAPVLGMRLQMYCVNRGDLVPVLGGVTVLQNINVLCQSRRFGACFGHRASNVFYKPGRFGTCFGHKARNASRKGGSSAEIWCWAQGKQAGPMHGTRPGAQLQLAAGNHGPRAAPRPLACTCACYASGETSYGLNLCIGCKCL